MNINKDDLRDMSLSPEMLLIIGHLMDRIVALENKDKTKRTVFKAPNREEVGEYMLSRGHHDCIGESDKFCNFYESNGWKVGKNKMKDWRASVRQWLSRQNQNQPSLAITHPVTQKQQVRTALRDINGTDW